VKQKSEKQPHALELIFETTKLCGAKTRAGAPCKSPPVRGKNRCRMHGGAKGSGAPIGNKNALKHGFYTKDSLVLMKMAKKLLRDSTSKLSEIYDLF
jgi:uncharacterized protein YjcR